MFAKIGILGLGLIGGSLARALKKYNYPATIYGYNRNQDALMQAKNVGAIDVMVDNWKDLEDCDLIVLCCPVNINIQLFESIKPYLKENVIITDVGSTKNDIYDALSKYEYSGYFIGGHPMAGSEQSGFDATKAELFENAYYVLTPEPSTPQKYIDAMSQLVATLHAIPTLLDPVRHDFIVAAISHVPHILASSLVNMVEALDTPEKEMYTLAAGGFKDFTRIASSSPDMWQQICVANHEAITSILDAYIHQLKAIRKQVTDEDDVSIFDFFQQARRFRNTFQNKARGSIDKSLALFVDINDETGVIADIATRLSQQGISIKNIGINNNREDFGGVLEILFYDELSLTNAIIVIENAHYKIIES